MVGQPARLFSGLERKMESDDRIPKITDYRESAVSIKYKIQLFWMCLAVFLFSAVISLYIAFRREAFFSAFGHQPYQAELGFLLLGVAGFQLFVISRLRKRMKKLSQGQDFEGDGGRQRT
jgi:hypothetical protein